MTSDAPSTPSPSAASTALRTSWTGERGPVTVFLHGLFGRGRNFAAIAKALQPDICSLLVDLPNHGESPWTERFDYEEMADAVAETVREQAGDALPVDVVGHSMGGKVAMVLALKYPELVRKLVVVDISPVRAEGGGENFEHLLGALAELDLETLASRNEAHELLRQKIPNDGVRGFLLQNLRPVDGGFAWGPNLRLLRESLPLIGGFPDLGDRSFDGPVLWVAGEKSDYVQDEHLPTMRALFPRVRRITVKGAGHWVHSEKQQEFITVLEYFLKN